MRHSQLILWLGVVYTISVALSCPVSAADFHVSPQGRSSGNGSISSPWDLATALAHPRTVAPGDRIWLHAGVYKGTYLSTLAGNSKSPIIVRPYGNDRVILDREGRDSQNRAALTVIGPHVWFWGFEVTNSSQQRVFENAFQDCADREHCRPPAVTVFGVGVRVINLVIHDTGDGIGLWTPAIDAEAYGNIVFYTGWQSEVRGNGHSLYIQNNLGTKRVIDNVLFSGFHSGVHFYGSSGSFLRNLYMEGNTIFNTGLLARDPNGWGILIGGSVRAEDVCLLGNYLYNPAWFTRSNNINPSYREGAIGVVLRNNYSVGYRAMGADRAPVDFRTSNNTFAGIVDASLLAIIQGGQNNSISSFQGRRDKPHEVFIRRNQYEPRKANITVYNWRGTTSVDLDLSSLLAFGDMYEIIDIQNYFGQPIRTGAYDGRAISVPMVSGTGTPVGTVPGNRYRTDAEFGVFQLRILSGSLLSAEAHRHTVEETEKAQLGVRGAQMPGGVPIGEHRGKVQGLPEQSHGSWSGVPVGRLTTGRACMYDR